MDTQVDYSKEGVGKFVALIFPDGYTEKNPGIPARELLELLRSDVPVGHMWGDVKILEFFWLPELDRARVNRALSSFQNKYPGLQIKSRTYNRITM